AHRQRESHRGAAKIGRRKGFHRPQRGDASASRRWRHLVTIPRTPSRQSPAMSAGGDLSTDSFVRRAGRQLIFTMYGALRAVKLYPVENAAVQKALAELTHQTKELLEAEHELELRMSGEFIFVNQTRLRLELDNFASFSHLLALFRISGVGSLTV